MTERPRQRIEDNRQKIRESDQLDDRDVDLLLEFDRQLELRQLSDARHLKLVRHCRVLAGHVETSVGPDETAGVALADALDDREAAEDLVAWINRQYDNAESNRDYRVALRTFAKTVTDGDDVPETIDWVPSTTPRSYNPTPDPAEMLDWDETETLIQHAYNPRDKALLAVAWDAGLRGGEMHDLRLGDVADHDHGLQIHVDGKQGQRTVPLFVASGHLSRWLSAHPESGDDTAPLWCRLSDGTSKLSYQRLLAIPKDVKGRCEVSKPVTFTAFRKSSASHLASQGVTQAVLEDHHGWCRGSDVAGRYVAVFSEASDREIAAAHGLEIASDDDDETTASVACPRCGERTPASRAFCIHCQAATDPEASSLVKELTSHIDEELVAADDASDRQQLLTLRQKLTDEAGQMTVEDLHQFVSSFESSS